MLATSLVVFALFPAPDRGVQIPSTVRLQKSDSRFVDFTADLDRVTVAVVLGRLDKFKDGKRKRIRDKDAHLGTGGGVKRLSGTQFYRVTSRTKVLVDHVLAGRKVGSKLAMRFETQLARLPGGETQRQILGKQRVELHPEMRGLFVVETNPKGKTFHVLRVLPIPPKQKPADFEKDARDVVAINLRIIAIRDLLAAARKKHPKDPVVARGMLERELGAKVKLRNPANQGLADQHLGPWRQRIRDALRKMKNGV